MRREPAQHVAVRLGVDPHLRLVLLHRTHRHRTAHTAAAPVVVHIPHSATALPDDFRAQLLFTDAELAEELRLMTDHHTAELASDVGRHGATRMVNGWSRLAVDPERFLDPDAEEMESVGIGAVYTRTSQGRPLRELSPEHRADLFDRHFHPCHAALTELVAARIEQHGHCVLLDLHSYPSRALPYELHAAGPRPEVDIGTYGEHTPGWLRDLVAGVVTDAGFGYAENTVPDVSTSVDGRWCAGRGAVRTVLTAACHIRWSCPVGPAGPA